MLTESLETIQEFETKGDLINYLQSIVNKYGKDKFDCNKTTIKPFGFDERIDWDSYVVHLDGWGVFGFTDGPVET